MSLPSYIADQIKKFTSPFCSFTLKLKSQWFHGSWPQHVEGGRWAPLTLSFTNFSVIKGGHYYGKSWWKLFAEDLKPNL